MRVKQCLNVQFCKPIVLTANLNLNASMFSEPHVLTPNQVAKDLESVTSKIISLKREAERTSEATTMGEKSLMIARQQAADARKLFNPLNHPKLQALMGKK
jgi:hypothetical protein